MGETSSAKGDSMRIILIVLTNKRELMCAVDFNWKWPFIVFENMTNKDIGEK